MVQVAVNRNCTCFLISWHLVNFVINNRTLEQYFGRETAAYGCTSASELLDVAESCDLTSLLKVVGGQAGAIRRTVSARALIASDETLKTNASSSWFVTRDVREVERKKLGLRKARKHPRFSKR